MTKAPKAQPIIKVSRKSRDIPDITKYENAILEHLVRTTDSKAYRKGRRDQDTSLERASEFWHESNSIYRLGFFGRREIAKVIYKSEGKEKYIEIQSFDPKHLSEEALTQILDRVETRFVTGHQTRTSFKG